MIRFFTENSEYELDEEKTRIRRVTGKFPPTPNQGDDGVWRTYDEISPIEEDVEPVIWWDNSMKVTRLSVVKRIA